MAPISTRFALIASLKHASTLPIFLTYLVASVPILFAYTLCANWVSTDPRLGFLFFHKGYARLRKHRLGRAHH